MEALAALEVLAALSLWMGRVARPWAPATSLLLLPSPLRCRVVFSMK